MRGISVALAVLLSACAGGGSAASEDQSVCDEAVASAASTRERFEAAHRESGLVVPARVDPNLRETVTEGEFISPKSEAQAQANVDASRERERLQREAATGLVRWATIVDQNADCFDVETRATAGQVLRRTDG